MLERLTAQINAESSFRISDIQPCGSMEEKSSILKTVLDPYVYNGIPLRLEKYIEFDYLAIIDKPDDVRLDGSCPACHLGLEYTIWDEFPLTTVSDDVFSSQLGRSIASLCSCFSFVSHCDKDGFPLWPPRFSFEPANPDINGCPSCTVTMGTGCLTVMPKVINCNRGGCPLKLLWTSYISSLSDFDCNDTLLTTKQIQYLPIHIDFIPACKISGQQINGSNPLFFVPKRCSFCKCYSRLSDCLSEIEYFLNSVSENHRKTYLIIKFISQFFVDLPKYHLKVILFQHCKICTDTSEDYTTCVKSILRELEQSYENGVLMAFRGNVNLLKGSHNDPWHRERIATLNCIFQQLSNFKTWTLIRRVNVEELLW